MCNNVMGNIEDYYKKARNGNIILDEMNIVGTIGCGSEGCVFVYQESNNFGAVKYFCPAQGSINNVINNMNNKKNKINNKGYCKYLVKIDNIDKSGTINGAVYVKMEAVFGQNCALKEYLIGKHENLEEGNDNPQSTLLSGFLQLTEGLCCLHDKGFIHGDISLNNVLAKNTELVWIDYDLGVSTVLGTPGFIAPELLTKKGKHTKKTDVYALGILFAIMVLILEKGEEGVEQYNTLYNNNLGNFEKNWNNDNIQRCIQSQRAFKEALLGAIENLSSATGFRTLIKNMTTEDVADNRPDCKSVCEKLSNIFEEQLENTKITSLPEIPVKSVETKSQPSDDGSIVSDSEEQSTPPDISYEDANLEDKPVQENKDESQSENIQSESDTTDKHLYSGIKGETLSDSETSHTEDGKQEPDEKELKDRAQSGNASAEPATANNHSYSGVSGPTLLDSGASQTEDVKKKPEEREIETPKKKSSSGNFAGNNYLVQNGYVNRVGVFQVDLVNGTDIILIKKQGWDFSISLFPITRKQYVAITGKQCSHAGKNEETSDCESVFDFFVKGCTLDEVKGFLKFLKNKDGNHRYDLPSEEQWKKLYQIEFVLKSINVKQGFKAYLQQNLESDFNQCILDLIDSEHFLFLNEGLLEYINRKNSNSGFVYCIGRPPYEKWKNLLNPVSVKEYKLDLAKPLIGFRIVRRGGNEIEIL